MYLQKKVHENIDKKIQIFKVTLMVIGETDEKLDYESIFSPFATMEFFKYYLIHCYI